MGKELVPRPEAAQAAAEKAEPAAEKKDSKKDIAAGGYADAAARLDPGKPPPTALLPTPPGCVPLRAMRPGVVALVHEHLAKLALGESAEVELEGMKLVLRAESHFNPPGVRPTGWHKGISVYQRVPDEAVAKKDDKAKKEPAKTKAAPG
ncbi:MAG: hypothetical protein IT385_16355 [Deltaproteobacteria bacterium]|nr:hypothetical protein [Deltaproteobacteria bacterium]